MGGRPVSLFATDGHFLHGAGPVNEAMGGADTGICLDATGSIAWNPACTVAFKGHRIEFHATLFSPWRSLSSTVDANAFTAGSTMPYYFSASKSAWTLGAGAQAGIHYQFNQVFSAGLAYHSPIWFKDFSWTSADLSGTNHTLKFKMNLPQLLSMGVGISPSPRTHIGVDARWFNYANTAGFSKVGYNSDGSVAGFGWRNIWAVGGGVQRQIAASTKIIAGYNYSGNPVPAQYTFFNTPAPAIVRHHLSGGIVQTVHAWDVNLTYYHAFQNSITGTWISAQGAIPGTSVTSSMSENSLTIGFAKSF